MASAPSKLATAASLLVALWVITYWVTPAPVPAEHPVQISFGDSPDPAPSTPAQRPKPDPTPQPQPLRPEPTPTPQPTFLRPDPNDHILIDVEPEHTIKLPTVPVVPPTYQNYVSQKGDTFQSVARRFFGSTARWGTVAEANPNIDPNKFGPGTTLRIPVDPDNIQGKLASADDTEPDTETTVKAPPPPEPEYTEYVVQRGDTLSGISKHLYGRASLWQRIADANPMVNPDRLKPGTTLQIPPPPARN